MVQLFYAKQNTNTCKHCLGANTLPCDTWGNQ